MPNGGILPKSKQASKQTNKNPHMIEIKIVWHWNMSKRNKLDDPEIDPVINGHLVFDKAARNIQWSFAINGV